MKYFQFVLVIIACLLSSLGVAEEPMQTKTEVDSVDYRMQLEEVITRAQQENKFIGMGAVILQAGEIKALAASGERKKKSGVSVTINDQWHIGSITKSFTATAIATLVESGDLDWDTPLGKYFSDETIEPSWHAVTLHDLLTHTSGAPANFPVKLLFSDHVKEGAERTRQRQKAVLNVLAKPIKAEQTGKFVYSNVGYTIAGVIAERVTKKSWEALVRETVYQPLGLTSAGFGNPDFKGGALAQPLGHRSMFGFMRPVGQEADNNPIIGPAGIAHMTLTDLATYANEHLLGHKGQGTLLKAETYKLLHSPHKENYGYGWVLYPDREWAKGDVLWHNGSNTYWYAIVAILPELNAVIAITANDGRVAKVEKTALEIFQESAKLLE